MKFEKLTTNIEKGRNVNVTIRLMRHGEKRLNGELSKTGEHEAFKYGIKMNSVKNLKAYTSHTPRVVKTAQAIQQGAKILNKFKQRNRKNLSTTILHAPGVDKPSRFFRQTVFKRLTDAYNTPKEKREQKIHEAEYKNIQEWLSYDDRLIDETTNSPKNVARAVAHHLMHQINMSERLKNGSDVDLLNVTHEFMIAAIIKYAVKKQKDDGTIISGEKIMQDKQNINYLEGLNIKVHINEKGEKKISLEINGEPYILDMDALQKLSNEYVDADNGVVKILERAEDKK